VSAWYPSALNAVLRGDVHFLTDTFKAQLVGDPFTFDTADTALADVTGAIGAAVNVSVISITGGRVLVNDITFPDVSGTEPITALVVYQDTAGTDPLICCIDRRADTVPIGVIPNGGDLTFSFNYLVKI
jgi:hypothetical protein